MVPDGESANQAARSSVASATTASAAVNDRGAAGNVSGTPTGVAIATISTQEGSTSDGANEVQDDDDTVRTAAESPPADLADASEQVVAVTGQAGAASDAAAAVAAPVVQVQFLHWRLCCCGTRLGLCLTTLWPHDFPVVLGC